MKKIRCFLVITAVGMLVSGSVSADDKTIEIRQPTSTQQAYRISTHLEGAGTVIPNDSKVLKLRLDAQFSYDERVIARQRSLKSIRDYQLARAEIRLEQGSMISELRENNRLILSQTTTKQAVHDVLVASLGGPLTQTEFELIDTPANTLVAAQLFSKKQVTVGQTWKPDSEDLARFLNIDSVETNEIELTLESVENSIATIRTAGQLVGSIDGANTEITLNGTTRFDVQRAEIRDFMFTINQQRDIGLLAPGLQAVFKIKSRFEPIAISRQLSDQALAEFRSSGNQITDHLKLISATGKFSLVHPHEWRVISNRSDRAVLRFVLNGQTFGQCDIIPLPDQPQGTPQTVEQLKKSVENNLADNQAMIINSGQSTTSSGLDWIQVEAAGTSEGVSLHWKYYVITHADGRRLQMVFMTQPEHATAFAAADQVLLNRISFTNSSEESSRDNSVDQ